MGYVEFHSGRAVRIGLYVTLSGYISRMVNNRVPSASSGAEARYTSPQPQKRSDYRKLLLKMGQFYQTA